MLTVGSLFSGIGGMDLGLERAGHKVIWQSEIDLFANCVLKKHWPNVPNIGDVTKIDWSKIPYVDVIAGGYPCQPFSLAGQRRGTNDARHLWPYVRNAIGRIRPRYALLENVPGHVTLGLDTVLGEITALGYCAEWQVISAAAFGAPHLRERLFIVAYPEVIKGNERKLGHRSQTCVASGTIGGQIGGKRSPMANSTSEPRPITQPYGVFEGYKQTAEFGKRGWVGGPNNGWWPAEPNVGRVANGVSNRVDRLKGLGNAVVPQVAEFMGYLINQHAKQFQ